jgi:hypothetical protein
LPDFRIAVNTALAELDAIEAHVLDALAHGAVIDALALSFLLRRYYATGAGDLSDALGAALSRALAGHTADATTAARAGWLMLFVDAIALSDDERLRAAAARLVCGLQPEWATAIRVGDVAVSLEACLRASSLPEARAFVPEAIDELERLVGRAYEPGEGLNGGDPRDHIRAASALLTAYDVSGRLPYSMLAEELTRPVLRDLPAGDFRLSCDAGRVLCRLAALHDDAAYIAAAVVAPDADYRGDAERILAPHAPMALASGAAGAIYGLAISEWLALR